MPSGPLQLPVTMMGAGVLLSVGFLLTCFWSCNGQNITTTTITTVAATTAAGGNSTVSSQTVQTTTASAVLEMCEVLDGLQNMMMSYYDNSTSRCYVVVGNEKSDYNTTVEKCNILEQSADGNWTCRVPNLDTTNVINELPAKMKMSYYFIGLRRPSCNATWIWDVGENVTAPYKGNFSTLEAGDECSYNNYVISATGITPAYMNYTTQTFCECGTHLNNVPGLLGISFLLLFSTLVITMAT
ncbi:unnamed protein product [Bursaphelenchus xylophilus]|uniref:(pine wood nematode) hypothetical protein n=1 Tax=Bursaphelenchus xylophilus TaxID=6326 RepID=A0A7I8WZX4_BURXY|nr:unnamed protein product [Bursaphelenchus xylophilus]CAG9129559.1 unnamed protein product [Bursaphelenchus xylophilus]